MSHTRQARSVEEIRSSIVNTSLVISSILGSIAFLSSTMSKIINANFNWSFGIDALVISLVIWTVIRRHKLSSSFKTYVLVSLILLFSISDALFYGLFSSARVYLVLVPFFSIINLGIRKSIGIFAITILIFLCIGYMHHRGILYLPKGYEPGFYVLRMYPWIIHAIHITTVSMVIFFITQGFFRSFEDLIQHLKSQHEEISLKEKNYREIFNSTNEAIFIHNKHDGQILDVNDKMLEMFGYPDKKEALSIGLEELSAPRQGYTRDKALEMLQKASERGMQVLEWISRKKSGEEFWTEVSLRDTRIGGQDRILAVVRDISERKAIEQELARYRDKLEWLVKERTEALEATNEELNATNEELHYRQAELEATLENLKKTQTQLLQSEKMASVGILAAGIAHEINNPLNFISGSMQALENYLVEIGQHDPQISGMLEMTRTGIQRTAGIVESLNHYSRQDNRMETCPLHPILDNCLQILKHQIKDRIEIEKHYLAGNDRINCNEGKMHQVFLNVLANAVQAIGEKGKIKITTSQGNSLFQVIISDTGKGIPPSHIDKLTDPFFTTKEPGEGTGLGLYISQGILKEHDATMEFRSTPGEGTTVFISLPQNNTAKND